MSTLDKIARASRLESALLVSRMLLAGRDDQKPTQDGRHWGTGYTKAELHCWAPGSLYRPQLTRSPPVHPASHTAARAARRATRKQVEYTRLATAYWPSCSWQHDASSTFFSGDSFSSSSNVYQRSPPPRRAPSTRATPLSHHAAPVLVLHLHRGVSVAHQSQHQEQQQLGLQRHSAHRRAPQRASPSVESSQLDPQLASPSGEMSSWMVPRADQPKTLLRAASAGRQYGGAGRKREGETRRVHLPETGKLGARRRRRMQGHREQVTFAESIGNMYAYVAVMSNCSNLTVTPPR